MQELHKIYQFFKDIEPLKDTLRTGRTQQGRTESVAEHSWRLATMAMILCPKHFPSLDLHRVILMCLIHDLGEIINGDITAPMQSKSVNKNEQERKDFDQVDASLPNELAEGLTAAWDEYEAAKTPESRLVKALDKLETIIQHNQGNDEPDFDHAFDLSYGRQYVDFDPIIAELRRMVDDDTKQMISK